MRFARWVFLLAGISGILLVAPLYFVEKQFGIENPPPINHPEFFYGFAGVAIAWQVMFLVIASDPVRYRLAMIPAIVEKASFTLAVSALYSVGRVDFIWLWAASIDGLLGMLFAVAFFWTSKANQRLPCD